MNNTLTIKIIDKNIAESYGIPCCIGEITIGDFKETFEMPLEFWTMDDYQTQWKNGIAHIKTHEQSCLVAEIQDPQKNPRASLWVLYKDNNTVHIQNHLLFGKRFAKMLKQQPFILENCYTFITPRETSSNEGIEISEWNINLDEIV